MSARKQLPLPTAEEALALHHAAPISFEISPVTALCLLSQIQLALRHPLNSGRSADEAKELAEALAKEIIERVPSLAEIIRMGWDPKFDL